MNRLTGIIVLCIICLSAWADVYYVSFADKAGGTHLALSAKAIARREARSIELDSMDYAVSEAYLDSLRAKGAQVLHTSRWLNGATIQATDTAGMLALPFVTEVELTRVDTSISTTRAMRIKRMQDELEVRMDTSDTIEKETAESDVQLGLYNLELLRQMGYKGEGMTIAVIDDGYAGTDTIRCLQHLREDGRIIGYYDRTDEAWDPVAGDGGTGGHHGTYVLTCLAGETEIYHGAATEANYILIRSEEEVYESPKEIDNYVSSLELADSLGADIATTSLGYREFEHSTLFPCSYDDMNGRTWRSSIAATIAARKGMIICNAMGNDGNKAFHYLGTPADADSIVAIGAVKADSTSAAFSSFGPTSDGRIKPEVCAMGQGVKAYKADGSLVTVNGTSFATPLIAGLIATVWAAMPEKTNMQMRELLIESAHQYADPSNPQIGYGIPDAYYMLTGERPVTKLDHPEKDAQNNQINTETNQAIYYNLQGMQLKEKPQSGLYIEKRGSQVTKRLR